MIDVAEEMFNLPIRKKLVPNNKRLCKGRHAYTVVSLCKLFGVTKQAFYKYVDHSTDSSARERFVLEFVKRVRSKAPGIGG